MNSPKGKFDRCYRAINHNPLVRLLSLLASILSSIGVIAGVYVYIASAQDRQAQAALNLLTNLGTDNTGKKYALELCAHHGVPMNGIKLDGADISGADIANAHFAYGTIQRSNFTNANLRNVDFSGATLNDNDFSYADLTGATLGRINTSKTKIPENNIPPVENSAPSGVNENVMPDYGINGPHNNNVSGTILPSDLIITEPRLSILFCVQSANPSVENKNNILWPKQNGTDAKFTWPGDVLPFCSPKKFPQASCDKNSDWCKQS